MFHCGIFLLLAFSFPCKEALDKALQSGSSQFLEAVGGYVVARAYVRSALQFRATARLLFALAMVAGAAAAAESIFYVHWVKNIAISISGAAPTWIFESRLGLMRAAATFDHPIQFGTFCVGVFALLCFLEPDALKRFALAAIVGLAAFFSLSSAVFIGLFLVLAGAVWERATRPIPFECG